jgi:endogenous inhibitor of DNA gyrase (YacG/DUF329 family)
MDEEKYLVKCPDCGKEFNLLPELIYVDGLNNTISLICPECEYGEEI